MKERQEEILQLLTENQQGLTASDVAERLTIDRSNASRYLSELYKAHHIVKTAGRPVVYSLPTEKSKSDEVHVDSSTQVTFETLVGENDSLKVSIQQAKAAILYPPRGLHTIILEKLVQGSRCLLNVCIILQSIQRCFLQMRHLFLSIVRIMLKIRNCSLDTSLGSKRGLHRSSSR